MNILRFSFRLAVLFLSWLFVIYFTYSAAAQPVEQTLSDNECNGLDIVLIIDQSTSMQDSDPDNFRIASVHTVITQLGDNRLYFCRDVIHRLGVISFGDQPEQAIKTQTDLSLTEINPDSLESWLGERERLKDQIKPQSLGSTDFAPAFEMAKRMFDGLAPVGSTPRKRAIILLTDGSPCVTTLGCLEETFDMASYLADLREQMVQDLPFTEGEGYYIWPVAMQASGATEYLEGDIGEPINQTLADYWQGIADTHGGELIRLSQNREQIPATFFKIITDLVGTGQVDALQCGPHYIEPYTERVIFMFFKSNPLFSVKMTHTDSGVTLENGEASQVGAVEVNDYIDDEQIERYVLYNPPPGDWQITADDCTLVQIYRETIVPDINLVEPSAALDAGDKTPHYLTVEIRERGSGQLLAESSQYPLNIQAKITNTNNPSVTSTQTLSAFGEGTYRSAEPLPVNELGEYQVVFIGTISAGSSSGEPLKFFEQQYATYTVISEVRNFDFEIIEPQSDSELLANQMGPLLVKLRLIDEQGQRLDPAEVFVGDPASWFDVILSNQVDSTSFNGTVATDGTDPNLLTAMISEATAAGFYTVDVVRKGQHNSARFVPIREQASISFERVQPKLFDFQILEPSTNTVLPVHESGGGCVVGNQLYPSVAVQLTSATGDTLDKTQYEQVLSEATSQPVARLVAPNGTEEEVELQIMESPRGPRLVGEAKSIPDLEGEYRFEVPFAPGTINPRFSPSQPSRQVLFERRDSWLSTPTACRGGAGLMGLMALGLLALAGWRMSGGPTGTLTLVNDYGEAVAGPWALRPSRRYQTLKGQQVEALGIKMIKVWKAESNDPDVPRAIYVTVKDTDGMELMSEQRMESGGYRQPLVDGGDILYE